MQLLDVDAAADFPTCVQDLHATEGWSLCSWYDPSTQSMQAVVDVAKALPAAQNLHCEDDVCLAALAALVPASRRKRPVGQSEHWGLLVVDEVWILPAGQTPQSVVVEVKKLPAAQNLHVGLASSFLDWYLPLSHGEQVNVLVRDPTLQLRLPDP